jgi:valyl-tRNA synthetase
VHGEFCDWYIELVKHRLGDGAEAADVEEPEALSATLLYVLGETLALAHPVIPFVTEEIWSQLPGNEGLLAGRSSTPPGERDESLEAQVNAAIEAVRAVRRWRKAHGVSPSAMIPAHLDAEGY